MAFQTLKSAITVAREDGLRKLIRKAREKLASTLPQLIREVHPAENPVWLSGVEFHTYCLDDSAYVNAQTEPNKAVEIEITVSNADSIEIPLIGAGHSEKIDLSTTAQHDQLIIDPNYSYPSQLWKSVDIPEGTDDISILVSPSGDSSKLDILNRFTRRNTTEAGTRVGLPAIRPNDQKPAIILISIDTLPYTERPHMQPLVDALGDEVVVPTEPRTQGYWTAPSHASMFTGSHPSAHGYVGHGRAEGDERPINPAMTTLPELLTDHGYKCSCLVSHTRILPEFGFGRGCHRFRADTMRYSDWVTRDHDARHSVNQLMEWIDSDVTRRDHSLFYFLHVFDPHFPYLPPLEYLENGHLDLSASSRYREQFEKARAEEGDYLRMYRNEHEVDPDLVESMEDYLSISIEYTATHLARLVRHLRSVDLFEDALIIVTGDHGEEFGERGFFTHSSLYDRNIRPFMAIKPPSSADWDVPDAVDTIDFLPTVAQSIDADVPKHCTGIPMQIKNGVNTRPRITERIRPDWYNVSVELEGIKGIFTYESGYPDRPSVDAINAGPVLTEFYELDAVRSGDFSELDSPSIAKELQAIADQFALERQPLDTGSDSVSTPAQETEEQLRDLGYM